MIEFEYYRSKRGRVPFEDFLNSIPNVDRMNVLKTIQKVQVYGLEVSKQKQIVKKLQKNLYEIRSRQANNIQRVIYFEISDSHYVITHGFTKKSQKTPIREINRGLGIRSDYLKGDD